MFDNHFHLENWDQWSSTLFTTIFTRKWINHVSRRNIHLTMVSKFCFVRVKISFLKSKQRNRNRPQFQCDCIVLFSYWCCPNILKLLGYFENGLFSSKNDFGYFCPFVEKFGLLFVPTSGHTTQNVENMKVYGVWKCETHLHPFWGLKLPSLKRRRNWKILFFGMAHSGKRHFHVFQWPIIL